jgi:hypothetical protein
MPPIALERDANPSSLRKSIAPCLWSPSRGRHFMHLQDMRAHLTIVLARARAITQIRQTAHPRHRRWLQRHKPVRGMAGFVFISAMAADPEEYRAGMQVLAGEAVRPCATCCSSRKTAKQQVAKDIYLARMTIAKEATTKSSPPTVRKWLAFMPIRQGTSEKQARAAACAVTA